MNDKPIVAECYSCKHHECQPGDPCYGCRQIASVNGHVPRDYVWTDNAPTRIYTQADRESHYADGHDVRPVAPVAVKGEA